MLSLSVVVILLGLIPGPIRQHAPFELININTRKMITLCITIGGRPDLLRRTLESLLSKINVSAVIAINDFRDEPSNAIFREFCPDGLLINLEHHVGHHKAVDAMYAHVKTPYLFHCEDDWLFDEVPKLSDAIELLAGTENISTVCFRKISDFDLLAAQEGKVTKQSFGALHYFRLDRIHEQWHGYTFNPHLTKTWLWRDIGGFAKYKKERHISRWLRSKGSYVAYIDPGACHHLGEFDSVSNPVRKSLFRRLFARSVK